MVTNEHTDLWMALNILVASNHLLILGKLKMFKTTNWIYHNLWSVIDALDNASPNHWSPQTTENQAYALAHSNQSYVVHDLKSHGGFSWYV